MSAKRGNQNGSNEETGGSSLIRRVPLPVGGGVVSRGEKE